MLKLKKIVKDYGSGDNLVHALKGIDLAFRNNEFVAILGPSGCGKTTLLNIIGGLDRYSEGDLLINGRSTKSYHDADWDSYRNKTIGFVFQSYNLIPHLSVQENVEMALSLAGVPLEEKKKRAIAALTKVGLSDKLDKRPSELSGGQMQRVAIARSLVNNPSVILADEPTGALDTDTGLQVMELLKEVAKDRLVIMVTHNPDLAKCYATRIINILDGKIVGDSKPLSEEEEHSFEEEDQAKLAQIAALPKKEKAQAERQSRMSFSTAFALSFRNLLTKKKRSFITSFACSIGVIGMAVILSVSNGMNNYIDTTMENSASSNYISISSSYVDYSSLMSTLGVDGTSLPEYPEDATGIYPYEASRASAVKQDLSDEYLAYVERKSEGKIIALDYTYGAEINAITQKENGTYLLSSSAYWGQILNNAAYLGEQYDALKTIKEDSPIPSGTGEVALVVDKYNRLSTSALKGIGIDYPSDGSEISYDTLLNKTFKVAFNNDFYHQDSNGLYRSATTQSELQSAYEATDSIEVKVVSILRAKKSAAANWINNGIGYSMDLTQKVMAVNKDSAVALAQYADSTKDVMSGQSFDSTTSSGGMTTSGYSAGSASSYEGNLEKLGYSSKPTGLTIYPDTFDHKAEIKADLDAWNTTYEGSDKVVKYTDVGNLLVSMLGNIINIITVVLTAFSAVSLVISSIMIAIIIYASVIERVKEIGVLRAMGARKKDISRIFRSEAIILGGLSGIIALLFALLDNGLVNLLLGALVSVSTIASMTWIIALAMMVLSIGLPLLASLIPASLAAKKDPVVALRSE